MYNKILILLFLTLGYNLTGQIKTKQIITIEDDSMVVEQLKEYYNEKGLLYLEEYTDDLGIYKAITYTRVDEFTIVDSIFEIGSMSVDVITTDLELAQVVSHHLNKQGDEVKVETYFPFENIVHTDKYYCEYSPANKKMVCGAYDDNSDSVILYYDSFYYNSKGMLSKKLTYFIENEITSSIENYFYTSSNLLESIQVIKNPDTEEERKEDILFNYDENGKLTMKQAQLNGVVLYTETFEYNNRGDEVKHIIESDEYRVSHLISYTYYY